MLLPEPLARLRAHGLLRKVCGTHRYLVTPKGRTVLTALLAASTASLDQLNRLAAQKSCSPSAIL